MNITLEDYTIDRIIHFLLCLTNITSKKHLMKKNNEKNVVFLKIRVSIGLLNIYIERSNGEWRNV